MQIHMGTDHAAFYLKEELKKKLVEAGYDVVDHGAVEYDALDDYNEFCAAAAEAVVANPGSLGIVLGGSGNGEQIMANKVNGIRAALCYKVETARLCREHNNANVLSLGARFTASESAWDIVQTFLNTEYTGSERHARRIAKVTAYENARK